MFVREFNKTAEATIVILIFAALAVVSTWPLVTSLTSHSIGGPNDNDIKFNTWVIFWGAHALTTNPLEMSHTNIFHPERHTFAYSDIELSHSLLMLPFIALFYNPELTYSLLVLLSIVIGGVGFYYLARDIVSHRLAAFFGALVMVFNPARFGRYVQIQFFGDHWLPWFLLALLRWLKFNSSEEKKRSRIWAALSVLFFCLHALSGSHNAVFGSLIGAMVVIYWFFRAKLWQRKQFWWQLAAMAVATAIVLIPVFYPYFIVEKELAKHRVDNDYALAVGSAGGAELLSSGSRFYRWLDEATGWPSMLFTRGARGHLFPALIPLLLGLAGFFSFARNGNENGKLSRWAAWFLDIMLISVTWIAVTSAVFGTSQIVVLIFRVATPTALVLAVAAIAAFLLRIFLFPKAPHCGTALWNVAKQQFILHEHQLLWLAILLFSFWALLGPSAGLYMILGKLPFVRVIRVPRRFILVAVFALAILVAYGVRSLCERFKNRTSLQIVTVSIFAILFAVESAYAPIPLYPVEPVPEVYTWLGEQEGDFAVMEFPVDPRGYAQAIRQVYGSIHHWKKLIVGYSGYQSDANIELLQRLNQTFPSPACIDELKNLDVRYVLAFEERLTDAQLRQLEEHQSLQVVKKFGRLAVYEIISSQD